MKQTTRQYVDGGFTLVEILVALLLLTIVMTGTLALHLTTIRASSDSRTISAASAVAQSRLESFHSREFTAITLIANEQMCFNYDTTRVGTCTDAHFFERITNVTANGLNFVCAVEVRWITRSGLQRSVVINAERAP